MYDSGGGYLRVQGRDPLFVWLITAATWVFGYQGYETFRNVAFFLMTLVAARWAYLARGVTVVTALTIFAALISKFVVQFREALAFLILAWPLFGIYAYRHPKLLKRPRSLIAPLVGAVIGAMIHIGTAIYLGMWLGAAFLTAIPQKYLNWRLTPRALILLGTAGGLALGIIITVFPQSFVNLVVELAGGAYASPDIFVLKIMYWGVLGVLTYITGGQVVAAARGSGPFGYAYALILGRFALPLIFSTTGFLVVTSFSTPEVTQWGVRILVSMLQLALLIVTLRGRANYVTLLFSTLLLVNESRAFLTTWGLTPTI
jgi:hypothetical protein